jgi:hypothetical protein
MKLARIILVPLFALALLLTQIAPFVVAPARVNCGCRLAVCCCCQTPANPNSAPQPAAPARTVTPDLQMVATVVQQTFSSADSARLCAFHGRPSLEALPIPLYQRDCVLLI